MTTADTIIWFSIALFNLLLAALVGAVRPGRLANHILAGLLAFNGLYGLKEALHSADSVVTSSAAVNHQMDLLLTVPTFVAFIILPFLFPRRVLARNAERALLSFGALLLLVNGILTLMLPTGYGNSPVYPMFALTAYVWFYLGIVIGCLVLLHTYLTTPSPLQRRQALFLLGAYVLKLTASDSLTIAYVLEHLRGPRTDSPWIFPMNVGYAILLTFPLLVILFALAASRLRSTRTDAPSAGDWFLVALLAFPLLLYAADESINPDGFGGGLLAMEYMIARPFLLAFAMLRYQMMEVDLRERRALIAACMVTGLLSIAMVTTQTLGAGGLDQGLAAVVGFMGTLIAAAIIAWPLMRLLVNRGAVAISSGRDLYQAALTETVAARTGHATSNDRVLRALRERLHISEQEHAAIHASVEAAFTQNTNLVQPGQDFLGRYEVQRLLGEGGFGRTYLAMDRQMRRPVVLKAANAGNPHEARRILREARLLGRIAHPNIVTIYDVEMVGDACVIVMEYLEGGSLVDALGGKRLPVAKSARIIEDVLQALEAAHAEGIIHRDVKPANILLTRDGRAKLADFGVARQEPGSGTLGGASLHEGQAGSLLFMAPEQVRGTAVDVTADLYAVGAVWYQMLTGRHYLALGGRSDFETRLAILEERPRLPLPRVPKPVNDLLSDLLAKDPGRRPADVKSVQGRIRKLRPLLKPEYQPNRG